MQVSFRYISYNAVKEVSTSKDENDVCCPVLHSETARQNSQVCIKKQWRIFQQAGTLFLVYMFLAVVFNYLPSTFKKRLSTSQWAASNGHVENFLKPVSKFGPWRLLPRRATPRRSNMWRIETQDDMTTPFFTEIYTHDLPGSVFEPEIPLVSSGIEIERLFSSTELPYFTSGDV